MRWFRQWAQRRRLRQRALFSFHDGQRTRYVDPAEAWRKLLNHPTMDFGVMVPLAQQGKEPETAIVLGALCEIFSVHLWDESTQSGMTTWEILNLIRQFDEYLVGLKKSTDPSQMPWLLLAYGLSTGSVSPPEAPEPANLNSDSSSTLNESNPDEVIDSSEPLPTA